MVNKFILILSLVLISCSKNKTISEEDRNTVEIINVLIDKYAKPIPPPPPRNISEKELAIFLEDTEMNKSGWLDKKMKVAIDPRMVPLHKSSIDDNLYRIFLNAQDGMNFDQNRKIIQYEFTPTRENSISYLDTTLTKKEKYKNSDVLIAFSRISFSTNYSKAILKITFNRGWSSGFSRICFLEQLKNGTWIIKYEKDCSS